MIKVTRNRARASLPPICFSTDPTQKTEPPRGLFSCTACRVHIPHRQHAQAPWMSTVRPSEPQFYHLHRGELT